MDREFNTPVLFLVFNRIEVTKQVFQAIRETKPNKLFIACDGPRSNVSGEDEKVRQVRNYILENIDWPCDVQTLFREKNLGCKVAVSSAIDWFFDSVEQGIILEDDCLPSSSFFYFCEELLERYKDDLRIWHIAGNYFLDEKNKDEYDYYFSYYGSIWGWATWRSRWKHYSVEMQGFEEIEKKSVMTQLFGNIYEARFREANFRLIRDGYNTWDFQWAYSRLTNSGLSVVPYKNLVQNIGFGEGATHTVDSTSELSRLRLQEIGSLKHPWWIVRNKSNDDNFFKRYIKNKSIFKKIAIRLKKKLFF